MDSRSSKRRKRHILLTQQSLEQRRTVCVSGGGGGSNAMPSGDQNTVPGAVENKKLFRMFGSQWY